MFLLGGVMFEERNIGSPGRVRILANFLGDQIEATKTLGNVFRKVY